MCKQTDLNSHRTAHKTAACSDRADLTELSSLSNKYKKSAGNSTVQLLSQDPLHSFHTLFCLYHCLHSETRAFLPSSVKYRFSLIQKGIYSFPRIFRHHTDPLCQRFRLQQSFRSEEHTSNSSHDRQSRMPSSA